MMLMDRALPLHPRATTVAFQICSQKREIPYCILQDLAIFMKVYSCNFKVIFQCPWNTIFYFLIPFKFYGTSSKTPVKRDDVYIICG